MDAPPPPGLGDPARKRAFLDGRQGDAAALCYDSTFGTVALIVVSGTDWCPEGPKINLVTREQHLLQRS